MAWAVVIVVSLILLGPLRGHVGKHLHFTCPAIIGAILGAVFGRWAQTHGAWVPGLPLMCAVAGALITGGEGKKIMDEWFGEKK